MENESIIKYFKNANYNSPSEIPLDYLKIHPMNSKLFNDKTDEEIRLLAKDIKENGLKYPIEIDKRGIIIKGSSRFRAVKLLGWKQIKYVLTDISSENELLLELVRDNTARRHLTFADRIQLYKHFVPEFFKNKSLKKDFFEKISSMLAIKVSTLKKDLTKIKSGKSVDANKIQYDDLKRAWISALGRDDVSITVSDTLQGTHILIIASRNKRRITFGPNNYSVVMREAYDASSIYRIINGKEQQQSITLESSEIGTKIRDMRISAKFTQQKLAKKLNISQSYLSEIEQGLCRCNASILDEIMKICI